MSSIKKNLIYNSVLTVANYIFPILVFPYVSRVIGVSKIGVCSFVDSIIDFSIIIASLGISIIGVREIARDRTLNDRKELSRSFSSLFFLNLLATLFSILIVFLISFSVEELLPYREMIFIGLGKVISTLFLIEWLFKGVEDFKFITYRSIIVKSLYVISVFIFVRNEDDYIVFFTLSVLMVFCNALINWIAKKKHVDFSFKLVSFRTYFKPFVSMGLYILLTSLYTTFNTLYLGFVSTEEEVGYYVTSIKFYGLVLALFTALTTVMLPRLSALIAEKRFDEMKTFIDKSFNILLSFSIPIVAFFILSAPWIIRIFSGPGFEGAILPMRIIMPLILVIGLAQILIIQILIPIKADKQILLNSFLGGSLSIIFNIALVARFGSVGSAISLVISEVSVTCMAAYFVYKRVAISVPFYLIFKHIILALPYFLFYYLSVTFAALFYWQLLFFSFISGIYFFVVQVYVLKNELIRSMLVKITSIVRH